MDESCDRLLKVKKSCNIAPGVVDLSIVEDENYVKGGILSNPKLSWVSCGPRLTNLNNNNGSKRTGWTFGWASGDKSLRVVCVEELPGSPTASPILVVGCEGDSGSSLCFYHSGCSRVLKAIHFNEKITSVTVVSKSDESEENLSELLRPWNGVVAVGTAAGKVYLVDVWWRALERCIEDYKHKLYDEQRQSKLAEVTLKDLETDIDLRTSSVRHGSSTLALWLNEVTFQRGRHGTHPGLQNVLGRMPLEFLTVSALKYFPQISTLAVGYNSSCFQLWDLSSLTLLYTSALLEAMLPVFSFSLLEPSDDPRHVVYLWSLHHSDDEDYIPFAGMYILSYHEKHQRPHSNQFFYEGYSSCSIRYQLDLGVEMTDIVSGRIISSQSIHRSTTKPSTLWIQSEAEDAGGEEGTASLLCIAWEAWTPGQSSIYRKLTLFDLNQWYREYMPTSSDMEYSQFMAHFCLPDGQPLDARVLPASVRQFQALRPLDEHFYPSATSFECVVLQRDRLLELRHVGVQQEALETVAVAGPDGLLLPARLYRQCCRAGVRPLLAEAPVHALTHSAGERAYLLSVALEHGLTQLLRRCAAAWSDGSHAAAGATLPALLAWAWDCVQRYKKRLDRLCVPLFDYSGTALDTNDFGLFHHMICQLHRLRDLFSLVLEKYGNCIIKGNFEQQYMVINLVTAFYDSVFWCVRNKVLPEVNANEANINGCIPYFTDKISNFIITRRAELHRLGEELLLIDAVVARDAGTRVTDQWEREGGAATLGCYPPPSVQSLLRIHLIRGVPASVKHFIVTYFLLDVAHALQSQGGSETTKQKLLKYPTNFGLTESQTKIVEGFWCLDHKQFQAGVDLLLDSSVNKEDLQVYQHRIVLRLLAEVGEHKLALHYLTTRRRTSTEPEDVRMEMTLLLANDLIHEAFQFQRHHQSMSAELLDQFFKGCVETNKLDIVFKLPLNPSEEEAFMSFLDKTAHPQADDLRVLYLLSRSRYVEAIDMNERLQMAVGPRRGQSTPGRHLFGRGTSARALTTRDLIINSVAKSLPSITRDLADYCQREKHFSWKQMSRPTPLSVVVHTELSNDRLPFYKTSDAQLLHAAVTKTREIWAPLLATPAALKRKLPTTVDDTPFLRDHRLNTSANIEEVRSGVRYRTDDDEVSKISKRARLEFSPSEKENTQSENVLERTLEMDITCPESSAVLHTPLVSRVVKRIPRETHTPQSILKGRSGPNTPITPAHDRLGSPAVNRQIRFSLPPDDEDSSSPTKSEGSSHSGEGDYSLKTLTPRKSIHESSDLHSRLPTPSNPRVLRKSLSHSIRSLADQLQVEASEPPMIKQNQSKPSATVTNLMKIISSPSSTEEAYFSFQSSSSGAENKRESESLFKVPFGIEGNIEDEPQDETYLEDDEHEPVVSADCDMSEREDEPNIMDTTVTHTKSRLSGISPFVSRNRTNESVNLTLEYQGDTTNSIYETSDKFTQSISERQASQLTSNNSYYSDDAELKEIEADGSKIEINPEAREKSDNDTMNNFAQPSLDLAEHEVNVDSLNEGRAEEVLLDFALPMEEISKQEIKEAATKEGIPFKSIKDCHVMSESDSEPVDKEIKIENNVKEMSSDMKILEDSALTSIPEPKSFEQGIKIFNIDSSSFVPAKQDSGRSLRSSRGSTPLPQILDELVKKKRKSLSVSESKSTCESISMSEEKDVSNDTDNRSTIFSIDNKSEAVVEEGASRISQQNIEVPTESVRNLEESKSTMIVTPDKIPHKESLPITTNISPFGQGFVFGNQESLSASASSRNLTFEIGSSKLESEPLEESSTENQELSSSKLDSSTCAPHQTDIRLEKETLRTPNVTLTQNIELSSSKLDSSTCVPQQTEIGLEKETLKTPNVTLTQNIELSSSKLNFSTNVPHQTEIGLEKETLIIPNVTFTQNISEAQICSTTEEPVKFSEEAFESDIQNTHSISLKEFNENPSDQILFENNPAEISNAFNSDLPEDDQNQVLEFYLDTAGNSCAQQLEADSTADFELKMSEGESAMEILCYEKNEVEAPLAAEVEEEPVLETLKPVQYQFEDNHVMEEDNCYNVEEGHVDEEDIYGDLDEEACDEGVEDEDNESENDQEEEKEEVICLGSSSDDEPPIKVPKSSTPHGPQRTPKGSQQTKVQNETLDYEVEEDEEEVEKDYEDCSEGDESNSSSSYSDEESEQSEDDEDDSKIEKKNLYFSSESDSDTSHRRRSWKAQSKSDSNESLTKGPATTDEDTVESPPFELIGQDSQETDKLETIVEEPRNNTQETPVAEYFKPVLDENHSCEKTDEVKEESIAKSNESVVKESNVIGIEKLYKDKDVDIIKLAEESRQRRLETGSILDLKKRRSKRYSSASDLNEGKKTKLRRRSCSLHDFMSAFIKESKSSAQLSPEKEEINTDAHSILSEGQASSSNYKKEEPSIEPTKKDMPTLQTQQSTTSEMEFSETCSITSSLLPEIGSIKSNRTSAFDFPISSIPKPLENQKKRGKSFASRLSSLHDISEEIPENSGSTPQIAAKKSLRRSVSSDQLTVSTHVDDSRIRRSSSVSRWSEYAKAHESEMTSETVDFSGFSRDLDKQDRHSKSVWPIEYQKMKYVTKKRRSSSCSNLNSFKIINSSDEESEEKSAEKSVEVQQQPVKETPCDSTISKTDKSPDRLSNVETNMFNAIDVESTENSRLQRAQSEPSSITESSVRSKRTRRSSSTMKINEYHKRLLNRTSLKRKSVVPQEFEIIDSDVDSPRITRSAKKKIEEEDANEDVSRNENESKTFENNFENEQVELPIVVDELMENPTITPNTDNGNRTRRGHSEPPVSESDVPKNKTRTRRSSFSIKIEKLNKLVLPRHSKKFRASTFQPMEIVQSDEEKSFQKTPDQGNQDIELNSEHPNKEILETPVTSKKQGGKAKNQQKLTKEDTLTIAEETEVKEHSSPAQIESKVAQDYPQPPKKRGRHKKIHDEVISQEPPSEVESERAKEIEIESESVEEVASMPDKKSKKQSGKNLKGRSKQAGKIKESEIHINEEVADSLKKVNEPETHKNETVGTNTKSAPKKRKAISRKTKKDHQEKEIIENTDQDEPMNPTTEENSEEAEKEKIAHDDPSATPKKTLKRKNKDIPTPSKEQSDSENVESSLTESQKDEVVKPTKILKEQELLLDSPARRTRRSMSRASDTEMLTPTREKPQRRTRRSSVMSDVVLSTPNKYAESEISDASTEVNMLLTPTRRSARRPSISATPNTPDLVPEEFLMQRRLTRHQHSQLQKSFELSIAESPRLSRLEEVPEESVESEETNLTPLRASRRTKATASKTLKSKTSKK